MIAELIKIARDASVTEQSHWWESSPLSSLLNTNIYGYWLDILQTWNVT